MHKYTIIEALSHQKAGATMYGLNKYVFSTLANTLIYTLAWRDVYEKIYICILLAVLYTTGVQNEILI